MRQLDWLMSYPFSGSEVTIRLTQNCSHTSVATNYGQFLQFPDKVHAGIPSRPIEDDAVHGPFRFNSYLPLPKEEILTRTHCSGYCREEEPGECRIEEFVKPLMKLTNFFAACSSGVRWSYRRGDEIDYYNPYRVKKIVLQIRSPFSVVLSRYKRFQEKRGIKATVAGFFSYCKNHDITYGEKYKTTFYTPEEMAFADDMQCHGEFYRVLKWYNKAFEVAAFLKIKPMLFYFEDYFDDLDGNVDKLFDYVGLERHPKCELPFDTQYEPMKEALLYFTKDHLAATHGFIDTIISPEVREAYSRYEY